MKLLPGSTANSRASNRSRRVFCHYSQTVIRSSSSRTPRASLAACCERCGGTALSLHESSIPEIKRQHSCDRPNGRLIAVSSHGGLITALPRAEFSVGEIATCDAERPGRYRHRSSRTGPQTRRRRYEGPRHRSCGEVRMKKLAYSIRTFDNVFLRFGQV